MNARVERLRAALDVPLLVTNLTNVRYLTGFHSTNAAALVEADRVRLFADFRYAEAGRKVPGVEFTVTQRSLASALAEQLDGTVAFEAGTLTYAHHETLGAGGLELVPTHGLVEGLRAVKDEDEIAAIRRATEVTNAAFERLAREPLVGRTERELAWRMDVLQREAGGESLSFPTVVAAGANAANPHTTPGDRPVQRGELVIVDAGAVVDGYCSDCTRTFAAGELDDGLRDVYELCLRAQLAGLEGVRPGVSGVDADASARSLIEEAGHGEHFGHGLGHGIGLEVHELPRLSRESAETVEAGNVTSVEPGIYLPGRGGVRIEDLVVVRDTGVDVLTTFPKELVALS